MSTHPPCSSSPFLSYFVTLYLTHLHRNHRVKSTKKSIHWQFGPVDVFTCLHSAELLSATSFASYILRYYNKNDLMRKLRVIDTHRAAGILWDANTMSAPALERKHITKLHLFIHCRKVQNGRNNSNYMIRCHIYWFAVAAAIVHIILCITKLTTKHSTLTNNNMNLVVVVVILFLARLALHIPKRWFCRGEGQFFLMRNFACVRTFRCPILNTHTRNSAR